MIDQNENVILVDGSDRQTGLANKLVAHQLGQLHRAFSVVIFNLQGEILLQQRALHKYHSCGLWTNACCSHPRPGEEMAAAIERRLQEEMGFVCPLKPVIVLHYQTPPLDTGLVENEMLHLFAGITGHATFQPDPDEVMAWRWIAPETLKAEVVAAPQSFSYWFRLYLQRFSMPAVFQDLQETS